MIEQQIHELHDAGLELNKVKTSFFNKITTFSIGLTGLLIGLKPASISVYYAKIAFLTAIICLALCALFSLLAQHYEINFSKQKEAIIRKGIESNTQGIGWINKPFIYKVAESLTYICLTISILTLIAYVYLLEFTNEPI